jgi:hypothetical protein
MQEHLSEDREMIIYPNPLTSNSTLIVNREFKDAEVIIYNMPGKEIMKGRLSGNSMTLPKEYLKQGMYIVMLINDSNKIVRKVIVN